MTEAMTDQAASDRPGRVALWLAVMLTAGALGVSAYLSYTSLSQGMTPAGCGSGSGCAEVLASKWSRWLGVPVSVLALGVYVMVLATLAWTCSRTAARREAARWLLTFSAACMAGSALWFTYLQLIEVKAVCPYCMAGHVLGLLLASVLIWRFRARRVFAGALGLAAVGLMVVVQVNSVEVVATLDASTSGMDGDVSTATGRTVTMLDGTLTLNLDEEPLLGEADAKQVMVMMLDYACLHCRRTHGVVEEVMRQHPGRLAVVVLPMPLNHKCNPYAPEELDARFDESCELARIALGVFLTDADAYEAFDRWWFAADLPRTAESARAEAVRLVGEAAFEQGMADPRMQQKLARNVEAYGRSGADRVPVLILPGLPAIVGRVDTPGMLLELLDRDRQHTD